jgi:hypothetical protein
MTSNNIINLAAPVNSTDAATKQYVDDVAQGLHTHDSCNAATQTTLATISGGTVTYNNGTAGVGATLTTTGTYTTIDGVTLSNGMRILVKNEANTAHNGIYDRTSTTVLTRSTDFDTPTEMAGGDFTFVTAGTLYDNTGWVMPDPVTTVGTSAVVWVQFSGAGTYTAGTGLTLTGSQFSVNVAQPTITSVGTLTGLDSSGTVTAPAFTANTGVFTGNGSALTALNASNVSSGTLAQARLANSNVVLGNTTLALGTTTTTVTGLTSVTSTTFVGALTGAATTAGSVTTAAQGNITSVGTLTGLGVNGNITAANITANTGVFTGNGSGLSAIAGANVTGTVANATFATSAGTAGTVTTAAQPNITSVGTLTGLGVNGTVTAVAFTANTGVFTGNGSGLSAIAGANVTGAVAFATTANAVAGANVSGTVANATFATSAGSATTAGTVTTAAQPNITSVGTLTGLTLAANADITMSGTDSNINGVALVSATLFAGSGANLTTLNASNVSSGTLAQARLANSNVILGNTTLALGTTTTTVTGLTSVTSTTFVGALTGAATTAGTVTTAAQPNITSVGTLTGLTIGNATANAVFGNGTITLNSGLITGNGAGLSQLAGANVTGTVANATFATSAGSATTATSATTAGTVTTAAQPNITSVGTLTSLGVSGTVTASAFTANTGVFTGNGAGLSQLAGANVTGTVASATAATNASALLQNTSTATTVYPTFSTSSANGNSSAVINTGISANLGNASITATTFVGALSGAATSATTAGTVTTAAQPNITSVGTLTSLGVSGTVTASAFTANTGVFTGNANGLSSLQAGNLTGTVAQARLANSNVILGNTTLALGTTTTTVTGLSSVTSTTFVGALTGAATTAGTVTTAAQPNITSVGTLTSLGVSGNITAANITANTGVFTGNGSGLSAIAGANVTGTVASATAATTAGTVTTAAQPNITSVGTLSALTVTGNTTSGNFVGRLANGNSNVNIAAANGNVTIAAVGNSVVTVTGTGVNVNGTLNATGAGQIGGDLLVSGNAVVTGNLAINGNLTYLNVETIAVEDPIIQLQTGANGAAPVANSGKDVGSALNYFDTVARVAFMGWDVSNAEFGMASVATIASEVVTFTTYGNLRVGNIIGNGQALTAIAGANVTGTVANATFATSAGTAGTVTTNAQPNITSVGTLTSLAVTGNANVGNLNAVTAVTASTLTSNVPIGTAPLTVTSTTRVNNLNVAQAGVTDTISVAAGTGNNFIVFASAATGNVNELTSTGLTANLSNNSITATTFVGALSGAATSATTAGTVTTAAQPNITSTGTLTSLTVSGNISGANVISTNNHVFSVATAISAAGTVQGNATAITKDFNVVSTVASGAGVRLPTAIAGYRITVINTSANALAVYPATSGIINSAAANAAYSQPAGSRLDYISTTTTQWYTLNATYG